MINNKNWLHIVGDSQYQSYIAISATWTLPVLTNYFLYTVNVLDAKLQKLCYNSYCTIGVIFAVNSCSILKMQNLQFLIINLV